MSLSLLGYARQNHDGLASEDAIKDPSKACESLSVAHVVVGMGVLLYSMR